MRVRGVGPGKIRSVAVTAVETEIGGDVTTAARRQTSRRQLAALVTGNALGMAGLGAGAPSMPVGVVNVGPKIVLKRRWMHQKAGNTTNGSAVGGFQTTLTDAYWSTAAGLPWEVVFLVFIPVESDLTKLRIWLGLTSSPQHASVADGSNAHLAVRYFGGLDTAWRLSARSNTGAGNQTVASMGPTVSKVVGYALRIAWTGTAFVGQVALLDNDGRIGIYSDAVTITEDLPPANTVLQWAVGVWQDGNPSAAQEIYLGDADATFGV